MYKAKVSQNEQNKEDLAVKAFDRNNDSLEEKIEQVAQEPAQPKQLSFKARTYKVLSRLPKFLGGKFFDDSYKNCLYDFETLDLWEERRKTLNALENSNIRYYRDNNDQLKSSIACLEESARSLSEKIEAKYKEIYGEHSIPSSQKPKKRHNPKITQEDIDAFRNGVKPPKQKDLGEMSDIVAASTCLGILGGAAGILFSQGISKLAGYDFPQTINELNWFHFSSEIIGSILGAYIGYASQKDYQKRQIEKSKN
ncbi:hypothetical protein HY837_06800 [archaeon]|nr:hypothetical protein [archaeon]